MVTIDTVTFILSVQFANLGKHCAVVLILPSFAQLAQVQPMQFRFDLCLRFIAVRLLFGVQFEVRGVDY